MKIKATKLKVLRVRYKTTMQRDIHVDEYLFAYSLRLLLMKIDNVSLYTSFLIRPPVAFHRVYSTCSIVFMSVRNNHSYYIYGNNKDECYHIDKVAWVTQRFVIALFPATVMRKVNRIW